MTDYLTLAEALAIRDDQIERYGGSAARNVNRSPSVSSVPSVRCLPPASLQEINDLYLKSRTDNFFR
jgi:hypothetical protein